MLLMALAVAINVRWGLLWAPTDRRNERGKSHDPVAARQARVRTRAVEADAADDEVAAAMNARLAANQAGRAAKREAKRAARDHRNVDREAGDR